MLRLIPTPIGNLEDISYRSIKALGEAELVFCEDTRVTKKLLTLLSQKYDLPISKKEFRSFHHHNQDNILRNLDPNELQTKNTAYLSDAGMPCISDPGSKLVDFCINHNISYEVLPGANALLSAYAMSGFDNPRFTFFAFLPHKGAARKCELSKAMQNEFLSIIYESPHRLIKLLEEIKNIDPNKEIFLAKEITKLHQKQYKGKAFDIYSQLKDTNIKGEWVIILKQNQTTMQQISLDDIQKLTLPPKQKAKLIAKLTNITTKQAYEEILQKDTNETNI